MVFVRESTTKGEYMTNERLTDIMTALDGLANQYRYKGQEDTAHGIQIATALVRDVMTRESRKADAPTYTHPTGFITWD